MYQLNWKDIQQFKRDVQKQPEHQVISRAIRNNGLKEVSEDPTEAAKLKPTFSVEVPTGKVSNQKKSGRCWLFSFVNQLKQHVDKRIGKQDFQLSQKYIFFWDKIERANMFYGRIINTADRPLSDRLVMFILDSAGDEGGRWDMDVAIVQKYGIVPQSLYPDNVVTNDTMMFGRVYALKLRRDGIKLRCMVKDGAEKREIIKAQRKMLSQDYRIVAYSFGIPPQRFDFEYRDDKKKYHRDLNLTPMSFYQKYVKVNLDQYVMAVNSPDKKMNQKYSLPSSNNVVGGQTNVFLNMPMKYLKQAAIQQLKHDDPVWFGNDVLQQMDRKHGYLDSRLFRYGQLFNLDLKTTKAQRLNYHIGCSSHDMALTGVDLVHGKPTRWKVENSWGDKVGNKGYFVMSDDWMDKYVYSMAVKLQYLPKAQQMINKQKAIKLTPWDPLSIFFSV